ncbi:hypothetical protein MMC20_000561 [Loxospora ochrophaea]|nr:hypothetical protein [Loxospora ochrophaea]
MAQYASSSSSAMVEVHVVKVSNKAGDLTFSPNSLYASPGSMVQFQFYPMNHSVVQASFAKPCEPIQDNMPNVTGFFSGYMPTTLNATEKPVFTIPIKDKTPIWYYCSQKNHCQKGMVGVINPPATGNKTEASFAALAKLAPPSMAPNMTASSGASSGSSSSNSSTPAAGTPSTSSSSAPAQETTNAAGSIFASSKEAFMGMGVAGLVTAVVTLLL